MLDQIINAAEIIFSGQTLIWLTIGVVSGIIIGAAPGIGATVGMALFLPLTTPLDGNNAIILLISIYCGAQFGSSIAAVLVNVPGSAASAATTLDGYPMSRQGKAKNALAIAATSSAIGGWISTIGLILISPLLITIVLSFGSPEYFLMAVIGLSLITVIAKGSMIKGFIAGSMGIIYSLVGISPTIPQARYTFGELALLDGLSFIAALIGLFAIAEMLVLSEKEGAISDDEKELEGSIKDGVITALSNPRVLLKSSIIGGFIGSIPGAGASVANFVSYSEEVRSNKEKASEFGNGVPEGVIASETANNATVGGSLVPTLSFGIPGSGATAVLLGGLVLHGLVPGPDLFSGNIHITYSLFISIFICSVIIIILGLSILPRLSYITSIDTNYIVSIIIPLAVMGGYVVRDNWFDIIIGVTVIGIFGYFMKKYDYSVIAFVLGAVLGPIVEENLIRSLELSRGSWDIFVEAPLSILLVILLILILLSPIIQYKLPKDIYHYDE